MEKRKRSNSDILNSNSKGHFVYEDLGRRGIIEHQVSKLDTLAGIAIKYGVDVADIRKLNGLSTDLQMFALKTLQIPLPGKHPPSPCLSNGGLFLSDRISGVRKSSSTPSFEDQDASSPSPIWHGLPKPISRWKNKAALD
ncbi:hypothetical protein CUMW_100490 [Citrus unshiu]|nr:hypothetical protein CUMW_100490 [Citrus unshiu]